MKYDLSLVIACYNEELILEKSMEEIFEILDSTIFSYEIIFVDDVSKDRTRELIDKIIKRHKDKNFKKIFHEINTGRGGAVADGIRISEGEIVGFIDIDLEVHARYIPSCVIAIKDGYDIATAFRIYKFYWRSIDRYLMSKGYHYLLERVLGVNLKDTETGFKFFNRSKILPLLDDIQDKGWFWDTEIMVRAYYKGYKIIEIPSLFMRRFDKPSSVRAISDTIDYLRKLWKFRKTAKTL